MQLCIPNPTTMKKICILLLIIITQQTVYAQGVKIGGSGSPDAYAILDLDGSAGKGLLLPRVCPYCGQWLCAVSDKQFLSRCEWRANQSISSYFKVEHVNNSNLNATVRMNYWNAELNNLSEASLSMWQFKNIWSPVGVTTKSANQNYVELAGINKLTGFTLGDPSANTEFQLSGFTCACKGSDYQSQ